MDPYEEYVAAIEAAKQAVADEEYAKAQAWAAIASALSTAPPVNAGPGPGRGNRR